MKPPTEGPKQAELKVQVASQAGELAVPPLTVDRSDRERVALLICHGMGQQVQFETLDTVARAVKATAKDCHTSTEHDITVSLHPNDGKFIGRAELVLTKPNGQTVEAHFYEAYWAPLTEGRVTLRETLSFLVDAAHRGLGFAYHQGVFDRWMFGGREEFEIPAQGVLQLGLGLWVLLLVAAAFASLALVPVLTLADLLRGVGDSQLAITTTATFSIAACILLVGAAIVLVARFLRGGSHAREPGSGVDVKIGSLAPPKWRRRAMVLVLEGIIAVTVSFAVYFGTKIHRGWLLPTVSNPAAHPVALIAAAAAFVFEFVLLRLFVQAFLVEFAGDVAAYVSPFKVSKFEEIRHAIQERGRVVARFIYSAGSAGSGQEKYDRVFVIGHSLGSVIAYDTLNDSINRDLHAGGWSAGSQLNVYGVVQKTKLLLTFGSPLDKTAFVFRTQKPNLETDVREALATSVQPLIVSYVNRVGRWINIWSPSDWISGKLGYYDAPNPPPDRAVRNIENKGSWAPWTAHTEYWTDPLFSAVLHTALTGVCPKRDLAEPRQLEISEALDNVQLNREAI